MTIFGCNECAKPVVFVKRPGESTWQGCINPDCTIAQRQDVPGYLTEYKGATYSDQHGRYWKDKR